MKATGFAQRIRQFITATALVILLSLPSGTAGVSAGQIARLLHSPVQTARLWHPPVSLHAEWIAIR